MQLSLCCRDQNIYAFIQLSCSILSGKYRATSWQHSLWYSDIRKIAIFVFKLCNDAPIKTEMFDFSFSHKENTYISI